MALMPFFSTFELSHQWRCSIVLWESIRGCFICMLSCFCYFVCTFTVVPMCLSLLSAVVFAFNILQLWGVTSHVTWCDLLNICLKHERTHDHSWSMLFDHDFSRSSVVKHHVGLLSTSFGFVPPCLITNSAYTKTASIVAVCVLAWPICTWFLYSFTGAVHVVVYDAAAPIHGRSNVYLHAILQARSIIVCNAGPFAEALFHLCWERQKKGESRWTQTQYQQWHMLLHKKAPEMWQFVRLGRGQETDQKAWPGRQERWHKEHNSTQQHKMTWKRHSGTKTESDLPA